MTVREMRQTTLPFTVDISLAAILHLSQEVDCLREQKKRTCPAFKLQSHCACTSALSTTASFSSASSVQLLLRKYNKINFQLGTIMLWCLLSKAVFFTFNPLIGS